ncbi:hypothetical protein [uncultured Methanobrevibacter sp.]|uniref:hypothetical protein n=1 Tax=uncultured Methanobrevibacter sp. TaxID=253161 RepID=UPI0025F69439|nr:hypothetical protein [uncultured Methanobrevibacter sp.]
MENYEEKYKRALEICKTEFNFNNLAYSHEQIRQKLEHIFPELKESEDERIRKELIEFIRHGNCVFDSLEQKNKFWAWLEKQGEKPQRMISAEAKEVLYNTITAWDEEDERLRKTTIAFLKDFAEQGYENAVECIDWLEKQGEQKQHLELKAGHWYFCHQAYCERTDILTVKEGETFKCENDGIVKGLIVKEPEKYFREIDAPSCEPKFKVGDWCIDNEDNTIFQITKVLSNLYYYKTNEGKEYSCTRDSIERDAHLWTIQDAKDGDVLCCENGWTCIFKSLNINAFSSYCFMDCSKWFCELGGQCHSLNEKICGKIYPATKEQSNRFFEKMEEAGYKWDNNKKELVRYKQ